MKNPRNLLIFGLLGFIAGLVISFGFGRFQKVSDETDAIRAVLSAQQDAWNAGDIPAFMQGYAKTDDLRFASGGRIQTGWQTTLDGYLARYPDRATMGQLQFDILEVEQIDADDALVFGRWTLNRAEDTPTGLFTLHFQKSGGDWKVVSDHTSSSD
jgi:ketosteroid isomerase-like protein